MIRKSLILLCSITLIGFNAFAETEQQEDGNLISAAELSYQLDLEDYNIDEELDAESLEMGSLELGLESEAMRPPRRQPPRYNPPRREPPRHRPRPRPRPPRYTEVMCVAENGRGLRFRGYAYRPFRAEAKALRQCERASYRPRSCRILGCRVTGGRFYP
ncbi:MAG: hypothetical protein VX642_08405 [Bdellovibrionota bacterium]|nr:hypothetical protein [Bdellovibrionota bacterium]